MFLFYLFMLFQIILCQNDQQKYFEHERAMFNVSNDELPFNYSEYSSKSIDYFPTNGTTMSFLKSKNDKLELMQPRPDKVIFGSDYILQGVNYIWQLAGWKHEIHHNEEYWVYNNSKTDNVVVYFHGINGLNGIENIYVLNQIKQNASVYFPMFRKSFLLDRSEGNSITEHVDNVKLFIDAQLSKYALVGNSLGSARITILCKRHDCSKCSKIVLTDPIGVNLPYSQMLKHIIYGVYFQHKSTIERQKIVTVHALRYKKFYINVETQMNWYEFSIDSHFMEKYKDTLVLVIGNHDKLVSVDKTSYAMTKLCKVLYIDTRHGMVLATNLFRQLELF